MPVDRFRMLPVALPRRRVLTLAIAVALPLSGLAVEAPRLQCVDTTAAWACVEQDGRFVCRGRHDERLERAAVELETKLDADQVTGDGSLVSATGSVDIRRGVQRVQAPKATLDREREVVRAEGPVRLENELLIAYARTLEADLEANTAKLDQLRYVLRGTTAQGSAERADIDTAAESRLEQVSFTSCPGESPAWRLIAREITLKHEQQIGVAEDVSIRIGDTPILWLPAASFPLTSARRSGFLTPNISFGDDGLDWTQPYYLNLAPNYDLTLQPRLVSRRGILLGGEFRHLSPNAESAVELVAMPKDRLADDSRWRYSLRQTRSLPAGWSFVADLNGVSDDAYLNDFGDSLDAQAASVLPSVMGFYGRGPGYSVGVMADQYEILDPANPDAPDPYRRLPRAFAVLDGGDTWWRYSLNAEAVRFDRSVGVTGSRVDLKPGLSLLWRPAWGFLEPGIAWRHTRYRLSGDGADRSLSRSTPILSVDAGLYFDRATAFGNPDWRQTLEPRAYFLDVPTRQQDDFPVFDTAELDFSFNQLFRDNRYAGADRQTDGRQLALALTSRLIDDSLGEELLRASIGQIRYFEKPTVTLPGELPINTDGSVYVGEVAARIGDDWDLSSTMQWDPNLSGTRVAGTRLQYRFGERGLANLSYRYRRQRTEQLDFSTYLPLNERWSLYGRVNHSLRDNRTLESLGGFEYRSCCFAARVLLRHYLRSSALDSDNAIYFELDFLGLGSVGRKTGGLLSRAILGYTPDLHEPVP